MSCYKCTQFTQSYSAETSLLNLWKILSPRLLDLFLVLHREVLLYSASKANVHKRFFRPAFFFALKKEKVLSSPIRVFGVCLCVNRVSEE